MKGNFEVRVKLFLKQEKNEKKSIHDGVKFVLIPSENIDEKHYIKDGFPNELGAEVITEVLVQGLIGNIHAAHQQNFIDSAEHLRKIISKLEDGFVRNMELIKSDY